MQWWCKCWAYSNESQRLIAHLPSGVMHPGTVCALGDAMVQPWMLTWMTIKHAMMIY